MFPVITNLLCYIRHLSRRLLRRMPTIIMKWLFDARAENGDRDRGHARASLVHPAGFSFLSRLEPFCPRCPRYRERGGSTYDFRSAAGRQGHDVSSHGADSDTQCGITLAGTLSSARYLRW